DDLVTGVQTCALPIFAVARRVADAYDASSGRGAAFTLRGARRRARAPDSASPSWIACNRALFRAWPHRARQRPVPCECGTALAVDRKGVVKGRRWGRG